MEEKAKEIEQAIYDRTKDVINKMKRQFARAGKDPKKIKTIRLDLEEHFKEVIREVYSKTTDKNITEKAIKAILMLVWADGTYKDRVRKNIALIRKKIEDGEDAIKVMKVGSFYMERLIRTETNYFLNQALLKAYTDYKVRQYRYVAVIDERTSDICRKLHREIFNVEDAEVGVNYPPMHPFCRSTTIAIGW